MGIPSALSWSLVQSRIEELLSNGLVLAAVAISLALIFAPKIIHAVKMASSPSFREETSRFDAMVKGHFDHDLSYSSPYGDDDDD